jgi:hypothetical protein
MPTPLFPLQTLSQLSDLELELQNLLDDAYVDTHKLHRVSDAKAAGRCKLIGGDILGSGRVVSKLVA